VKAAEETSKAAAFREDKEREESSGEYLKGRWREVNGLRRKAEEDVAAMTCSFASVYLPHFPNIVHREK
jgi:hypothetical protein